MSIEEFAEISEPGRFDLIRGELVNMPPAGGIHGEVAFEIGRLIGNFVVEHKLGRCYAAETGFVLNEEDATVLAPDVAFLEASHVPPRDERHRFVPAVPDLVVEVVSPSDRIIDVNDKVTTYLDAGVRLAWVVEPVRQRVTVYTSDRRARLLIEGESLDGGDVLPGFQLPLADIFR
ncbi:MAG: Uma2 family endonuclease [Thermomicrobiales bacterium]